GGEGANDRLDIAELDGNRSVGIGAESDAQIAINSVEFVNAVAAGDDSTRAYTDNTFIASNSDTTWEVTGRDSGALNFGTERVEFTGFGNLNGGQGVDTFNLNAELNPNLAVSGLISGGDAPEASTGDVVIFNRLERDGFVDIALGMQASADFRLEGLEQIQANNGDYRLMGDNIANTWTVDGQDSGHIGNSNFSGFANLLGGNLDDTFVLLGSDAGISGSIDGGSDSGAGAIFARDVLDLRGLEGVSTVSLDAELASDIYILNLEHIEALGNNTLIADDQINSWVVDAADGGRLNFLVGDDGTQAGGLSFAGFGNLSGNNQFDTFSFSDAGAISGMVDGGDPSASPGDIVDMSDLDTASILIASSLRGFRNIEQFIGSRNGNSTFTASTGQNSWEITGINSGTFTDQNGDSITFTGYENLVGGDGRDEFVISQGQIDGTINAGDGDDFLRVDLGLNALDGVVDFNGGNGTDSLSIIGGSTQVRYQTNYTPNSDNGGAELEYRLTQELGVRISPIRYQGMEIVNDEVFSAGLAINLQAGVDDDVSLANQSFMVADFTEVNFTNKLGLDVLAEVGDIINIDGLINAEQMIRLQNATVISSEVDAELRAANIQLDNTSGVGALDQRLAISTNNLSLEDIRGDIYLAQEGDLVISELSAPAGLVDIESTGSIENSSALNSTNDLRLSSLSGDITLVGANRLSGNLSLFAEQGDIELSNGNTTFDGLRANNLTVTTSADIDDGANSGAAIEVANLTQINGGANSQVTLDNTNNRFESVRVNTADNFRIHDSSDDGLFVEGRVDDLFEVTADRNITVNGEGITGIVSGDVLGTVNDVSLISTLGDVEILSAINAERSVTLSAGNIDVDANITVNAGTGADSIDIRARDTLNIIASLTADGTVAGDIYLEAQTLELASSGELNGATFNVDRSGSVVLNGNLNASQNITLTADTLAMSDNGGQDQVSAVGAIVFTTTNDLQALSLSGQDITLISDGDIDLSGQVSAVNSIAIEAGASLTTDEGGQIMVTAGSVTIDAADAVLNGDIDAQDVGSIVDVQTASGTLLVNGELRTDSVVISSDVGDIIMTSTASVNANTTAILTAGGDIAISELQAVEEITLISGGAVEAVGDGVHLETAVLSSSSQSGFGTGATFNTEVAAIVSVTNQFGTIEISNEGDLAINALRSNGDITLVNNGSVTLINSNEDYDITTDDALLAGGVINAGLFNGTVDLDITGEGSDLIVDATRRGNNLIDIPEVIGGLFEVNVSGDFGIENGSLITAAPIVRLEAATGGVRHIEGLGIDSEFISDIELSDPSALGSVSELLFEIETIDQIDPAIFTRVNNYIHGDISIQMPCSQRFDDECGDDEQTLSLNN
ncbi:MAG: hypothetical protein COA42_16885, partial [Alteromonadaceae bacterium]